MARTINPTFANLKSLPDATKTPPRTYTIVAMRKYSGISANEAEICIAIGTWPSAITKASNATITRTDLEAVTQHTDYST